MTQKLCSHIWADLVSWRLRRRNQDRRSLEIGPTMRTIYLFAILPIYGIAAKKTIVSIQG